jgi:serine/threonine protein kinase
MSLPPQGHPPIPDETAVDSVVAIITIHHPQALHVNHQITHPKTELKTPSAQGTSALSGCHIYLKLIKDQPVYSIGRTQPKGANHSVHDIYLPGTSVGTHQFNLHPVWDSNCWRLQSCSETIATVNGVPIQQGTNRTRKLQTQLPHAIHLRQDIANHAVVNGLQIDFWLLKSVRDVYPTKTYQAPELHAKLQDVSRRSEAWTQDRYIMSNSQVSARSHKVQERFTGVIETAKLFSNKADGREQRNAEALRFTKTEVDKSIVRYIQSTEIDQIPAIITETHKGYVPYAALIQDIKIQHPTTRFSIAAKLLRRLFSALAFLHFQGIVHRKVTKDSVLLRLVDYKLDAVLLVDYSAATSFTSGVLAPLDDLIEGGRAAMEIIDCCCDIWQLRKAATKDAVNEEFMARKTEMARKEFHVVERAVADFLGPKGGSRTSAKGEKMLRLLDMKQNRLHTAQYEQIHNATRREVGVCRASAIAEMEREWASTHPPTETGRQQYMLLTLGHDYLDSLVSKLYHKSWDVTPSEVCAKLSELAGPVEEAWQTFLVQRVVEFKQGQTVFEEDCILNWLAGCCEAYPEWHHVLDSECQNHIHPQNGVIKRGDILRLRDAFRVYNTLPEFIHNTLERLTANDVIDQPIIGVTETHEITYHKPSRMFNVTQMHRLASPETQLSCVNNGDIRCENYVEVRGEPQLEGHYVSLSLLAAFGMQLQLSVSLPEHKQQSPAYDPAEFSRVLHHVVLAHTNLVPWASVTRKGRQFNFHVPLMSKTCEEHYTFLPTYFGSMRVLPRMQQGREVYARADRWDKFKTAEKMDEATNRQKRKILPAKGSSKNLSSSQILKQAASAPSSDDIDIEASTLTRRLEFREQIRAQARSSAKRNAAEQSPESSTTARVPSKTLGPDQDHTAENASSNEVPEALSSFIDRAMANLERQAQGHHPDSSLDLPRMPEESLYMREANKNLLRTSPPQLPVVNKTVFTVASNGSFNIEDDIRQTEEWLGQVDDEEDDGPGPAGIFGFNFHHSLRQQGDGSDSEVDDSEDETLPDGGKAKEGGLHTSETYVSGLLLPNASLCKMLRVLSEKLLNRLRSTNRHCKIIAAPNASSRLARLRISILPIPNKVLKMTMLACQIRSQEACSMKTWTNNV